MTPFWRRLGAGLGARLDAGLGDAARPWSWAAVVLMVAVGAGVREVTYPWILGGYYVTLLPVVIVTTLLWGERHGGLALGLSLVAGFWLTARQSPTLELDNPVFLFRVAGFLVVGGGCVAALAWVRRINARLVQANAKLALLYRELEHRVANTMQVTAGMLHRLRPMVDPAARPLVDATVNRIVAMARLHRRAYDAEAADVGLEQMLREAMADVFSGQGVEVRLEIQPMGWTVGQKTVLLLLVHEAAMNAAKHARRPGVALVFEVALRVAADGRAQLSIRDNGPGLPAAPDAAREDGGMGLGIIAAFAEQLGGEMEVGPGPGLALRVAFPVEAVA